MPKSRNTSSYFTNRHKNTETGRRVVLHLCWYIVYHKQTNKQTNTGIQKYWLIDNDVRSDEAKVLKNKKRTKRSEIVDDCCILTDRNVQHDQQNLGNP